MSSTEEVRSGEGKSHFILVVTAWRPKESDPLLRKHVKRLQAVCRGPYFPLVLERRGTEPYSTPKSIADIISTAAASSSVEKSAARHRLCAVAESLFSLVASHVASSEEAVDAPRGGLAVFPLEADAAQGLIRSFITLMTSEEIAASRVLRLGPGDQYREWTFLCELVLVVLLSRSLALALGRDFVLLFGGASPNLRHYFDFVAAMFGRSSASADPVDADLETFLQTSTSQAQKEAVDDEGHVEDRIERIVDMISEEFSEFVLRKLDELDDGAATSPLSSSGGKPASSSPAKQNSSSNCDVAESDLRSFLQTLRYISHLRGEQESCSVSPLELADDAAVGDLVWDVVSSAAVLAREVLVSDSTDPPRADGVRFGVLCKVASTSTDLLFLERTDRRPSQATTLSSRQSPGSLPSVQQVFPSSTPPARSVQPNSRTGGIISLSFASVWSVSEFCLQMPSPTAASTSQAIMYGIAIVTRTGRRWYLCVGSQQQKEVILGKILSIVMGDAVGSFASVPMLLSSNFAPLVGGTSTAPSLNDGADGGGGSNVMEQAARRSPSALLCACATSGLLLSRATGGAGIRKIYSAKRIQHGTSLRHDDEQRSSACEDAAWEKAWSPFDPRREFERQQLPPHFSIDTEFNAGYSSVPSYPSSIVVPTLAKKDVLKAAMQRRVNGRLEALTYFFHRTGGCIVRCSQPATVRDTISRWTSSLGAAVADVTSIAQLYKDSVASRTVETVDLRDKLAAMANVFKGGGYSSSSEFCAMDNIHAVRKSFAQLCDLLHRNATTDSSRRQQQQQQQQVDGQQPTGGALHGSPLDSSEPAPADFQALGSNSSASEAHASVLRTRWLDMIYVLLQTSITVARKVAGAAELPTATASPSPGSGRWCCPSGVMRSFEESATVLCPHAEPGNSPVAAADVCNPRCARVVIVHCSDGWDRTSQVCATSQILLDPYFRTIEGFCVLVDKDFVSFGHPFLLRSDHCGGTSTQAAPIFVQFLDAVRQLVRLFPNNFQFTEDFLLFVADCHLLGLAGNLISNCDRDRSAAALHRTTLSLWQLVQLVLCDDKTESDQDEPSPLVVKNGGTRADRLLNFSQDLAAKSGLVNMAYSHSWNCASGCGGGCLVGFDISPLAMNLWESFFLRHSPIAAASLDQVDKHRAAVAHASTAYYRQSGLGMEGHDMSSSVVDGAGEQLSWKDGCRPRPSSSGANTPVTAMPPPSAAPIPRNSSYSSGSAPASPAKRPTPSQPSSIPSDADLPRLETSSMMAPRNASVASLASPMHNSQPTRPPRPPSSVMNQFLLADDDE